MLGFGSGLAIILGVYDLTGAKISGMGNGLNREEDYGTKEWLRRNRRRPIQETIDELGEGRGKAPEGASGTMLLMNCRYLWARI